jgi:hypothetical protein
MFAGEWGRCPFSSAKHCIGVGIASDKIEKRVVKNVLARAKTKTIADPPGPLGRFTRFKTKDP